MANQNYSEFKSRRQNKNRGAGGYGYRKGEMSSEHGAAQKDTKTAWAKAPGPRSPSLNRVGWPIVKSAVNSDGIDV